jgi:hypothetical protein
MSREHCKAPLECLSTIAMWVSELAPNFLLVIRVVLSSQLLSSPEMINKFSNTHTTLGLNWTWKMESMRGED